MYHVTMNAEQNQEMIRKIRFDYNTGRITREDAKVLAMPIINSINDRAKELSKEHNVRYSPITFTSIMR